MGAAKKTRKVSSGKGAAASRKPRRTDALAGVKPIKDMSKFIGKLPDDRTAEEILADLNAMKYGRPPGDHGHALVQGLVMTEEQPPITVKGFPKPISGYKLVGTYNDLVKAGKVVLEERDGLHVLVDLTKQDRSDVIEILQNILTHLKQPKHAAGAARRRKKGDVEL